MIASNGIIAGGALWTPRRLNPLAWYRADSGTTGSPVSAWTSRVGTHEATQGTAANRPAAPAAVAKLGGKLGLACDGTDILGANGSGMDVDLSAGWSFFSVFRLASLGNFRGLFRVSTTENGGSTADDGLVVYATSTGVVTISDPGAGTNWYREAPASTVAADTGYALIGRCATGNALDIELQLGTIGGGTISWATLALNRAISADCTPLASGRFMFPGGGWSTATSRLVGDLAEQAVSGSAWSAAGVAALKKYLLRYA